MRRRTFLLVRLASIGLALVLGLVFLLGFLAPGAQASSGQPPGPDRFTAIIVDYTSYRWWLVGYQSNQIVCEIYTDHEGLPSHTEIYNACGQSIYDAWKVTPGCNVLEQGGDSSSCPGYYLYLVGSAPAQKTVGVALPPALVWVSLQGCTSAAATNFCTGQPVLILTGDEPLPNETILSIEGFVDGEPFTCGSVCQLPLELTDEDGIQLNFWAYSSYGDSSVAFEAVVRVADADALTGDENSFYVDVLSSQWAGEPIAGCAQTWDAFPPVGGLPAWLLTPKDASALASNIPYEYLAVNLVRKGVVNVSSCVDGGFLTENVLSPCGLDTARPAVEEWQNRFDSQTLAAALETGVPAQLLKNLFSRESQFWPGVFSSIPEVGLGQLTENGADTALLWNPSFYEGFCPLILDKNLCQKRYSNLKPEIQAVLRGAMVRSVDAFCENCPLGIDLRQANFSINLFAETLVGSCAQTGRIIRNITSRTPGQVSTYEDLWRFTLVNYNAGPGCLTLAIEDTQAGGEPLDWEHVSARLTPVCQGAMDYVEDINRIP